MPSSFSYFSDTKPLYSAEFNILNSDVHNYEYEDTDTEAHPRGGCQVAASLPPPKKLPKPKFKKHVFKYYDIKIVLTSYFC
jgi:hypothetical protein